MTGAGSPTGVARPHGPFARRHSAADVKALVALDRLHKSALRTWHQEAAMTDSQAAERPNNARGKVCRIKSKKAAKPENPLRSGSFHFWNVLESKHRGRRPSRVVATFLLT